MNPERDEYPSATQQQCPECHRELRADCCDVEILRRECDEAEVPREVEKVLLGLARRAWQLRSLTSTQGDFDRGMHTAILALLAEACADAGIGHADAMLRRRMLRDGVAR